MIVSSNRSRQNFAARSPQWPSYTPTAATPLFPSMDMRIENSSSMYGLSPCTEYESTRFTNPRSGSPKPALILSSSLISGELTSPLSPSMDPIDPTAENHELSPSAAALAASAPLPLLAASAAALALRCRARARRMLSGRMLALGPSVSECGSIGGRNGGDGGGSGGGHDDSCGGGGGIGQVVVKTVVLVVMANRHFCRLRCPNN
mmetsp:Transcript_27294/g.73842  ORF Transcript_27294/g.73842 Transcript_27294/m.73842 type:complete len:205 (-) Transcript_27294:217-831(-)